MWLVSIVPHRCEENLRLALLRIGCSLFSFRFPFLSFVVSLRSSPKINGEKLWQRMVLSVPGEATEHGGICEDPARVVPAGMFPSLPPPWAETFLPLS